ncbi:MAG: sigma-54-dependent transcriptional regulator [Dehalococcoidia bacterium]
MQDADTTRQSPDMKSQIKILAVDDEETVRESLKDWLTDSGYQVLVAEDGYKALDIIKREKIGILIADLVMPGIDGIELMRRTKEISPDTGVIIITAYGSVPSAVSAMHEGAYDYIEKPFCPERVESLLEKLMEHQRLVEENRVLREQLEDHYRFENIIAKSHKMHKIFDVVKTVAKSNASVLITGESGTGKELIARAIHNLSPRRDKPFVDVSCAALPESLLESELFGHERGAFTSAVNQRKGRFELAHRGTLFLDEIGEISTNMQVHLLRVLEEREFTRVGGTEPIKTDVRLISASNKNLKEAINEGEFRGDLYYRLNVVSIELPPLKERSEDIPLLAQHFLNKFARENQKGEIKLSSEAMDFLMKYDWPGNVRELENTIERAVVLTQDSTINVDDLATQNLPSAQQSSSEGSLEDMEKQHIVNVLKETSGNHTEAAKRLGITRMTLYKKVKKYGVDVNKLSSAV